MYGIMHVQLTYYIIPPKTFNLIGGLHAVPLLYSKQHTYSPESSVIGEHKIKDGYKTVQPSISGIAVVTFVVPLFERFVQYTLLYSIFDFHSHINSVFLPYTTDNLLHRMNISGTSMQKTNTCLFLSFQHVWGCVFH